MNVGPGGGESEEVIGHVYKYTLSVAIEHSIYSTVHVFVPCFAH